jgi:hypothetical protein
MDGIDGTVARHGTGDSEQVTDLMIAAGIWLARADQGREARQGRADRPRQPEKTLAVSVTVSVSVTVAVSPRSVLERFFGVLQRPTHRLKLRDPRGNHQIGHPVRIARAIVPCRCHRAIDAIRATTGTIGRANCAKK